MKIALLTGNQPRHLYFAERLASVADDLFLIIESSSLFPGEGQGHIRKSEISAKYFSNVLDAESLLFADTWLPKGSEALVMPHGELNSLSPSRIHPVLGADLIFVFGSSYVREPLVKELVSRKAINLHMGISPYYRGSSCNFWAMADGRPELVGATFHLLTQGLDSGPILWHKRPVYSGSNPFLFTMSAVKFAVDSAIRVIVDAPSILSSDGAPQLRKFELRYSRERDFTDEVISDFLRNPPSPDFINSRIKRFTEYSELRELDEAR